MIQMRGIELRRFYRSNHDPNSALPLTVQQPQLGRRCLSTTGAVFGTSPPESAKPMTTVFFSASAVVKVGRKASYGSGFLPDVSDYFNSLPHLPFMIP